MISRFQPDWKTGCPGFPGRPEQSVFYGMGDDRPAARPVY